uniref:RNA-binding S4 domain-containing protein n=1 Tax=Polytomella parva TaxID=51329 RepID=A0A7S0UYR3_9CHLO|mmetsp:Transcript_18669/g.33893  ORF Transcript_18669/g.33893 Transcript_18669/m.33893 type:complete len:327 (+) Transcript_18669:78-1058(+)
MLRRLYYNFCTSCSHTNVFSTSGSLSSPSIHFSYKSLDTNPFLSKWRIYSINAHSDEGNVDVGSVNRRKKGDKQRLDSLCLSLHPQLTSQLVTSYILRGKVKVNDKVVFTPGHQVSPKQVISIDITEPKYVCRGGTKLEHALSVFNLDVNGKIALDSGQSTGGFTDCLLQQGAKKVVGIDVGFNQLHEKIRRDPRVVVIERFNLRYLDPDIIPNIRIQIATLDLSFISVLTVLPAVRSVLDLNADVIVLVKPQFEAPRQHVMKGGVVTDPEVRIQTVQHVIEGARKLGFEDLGYVESPIVGEKSGNVEYLLHLKFIGGLDIPKGCS